MIGHIKTTSAPQDSNYPQLAGLNQRMNSKDPAQMQSAADEINAFNAQARGGGREQPGGEQTWWKPGASGGYTQVQNPTDFSGLISAQGQIPEYMRTMGAKSTSGSTNSLSEDVINKMWM